LDTQWDSREHPMSIALSVNKRAADLVGALVADAASLRLDVARGPLGERLIDAGSRCAGSIAAGLRIAEICMGGLGQVTLTPAATIPNWPWTIATRSSHPVIACLASQYAGWNLSHKANGGSFFALGSGPARALARREPLFEKLGYRDHAESGTLVLESAVAPPPPVVEKIARDCGI
jgi:methenyltetrahydromethanopterin cyclohydrolase